MKPAGTRQPTPEPPASDRYELTLRLEKGDTIEKMLADIDVPEADRKQIAGKLQALLKKNRLAVGETIELSLQTLPEPARCAARAVAARCGRSPSANTSSRATRTAPTTARRRPTRSSPRIVRVEGERSGSLAAERHQGGRAGRGDGRVRPRAVLRRRLPARAEVRPAIHRAARAARHQRRHASPIPDDCWRASSRSPSAPSP